jgi:hypothetical protein
MMSAADASLRRPGPEMTGDPQFGRRIKRLVAVSAIALGLITLFVATVADDPGWLPPTLMAGGWVLMPTILAYSLRRPSLRYLLALPAGAVSAALVLVSVRFADPGWATAGWWMMTAGVLMGGSLGMWFWYRLAPIPQALDRPFSPGRWALVATHIGLISVGWLLVLFSVVV